MSEKTFCWISLVVLTVQTLLGLSLLILHSFFDYRQKKIGQTERVIQFRGWDDGMDDIVISVTINPSKKNHVVKIYKRQYGSFSLHATMENGEEVTPSNSPDR